MMFGKSLNCMLLGALLLAGCSESVNKDVISPAPTPYPTPFPRPQPFAVCPALPAGDGSRLILTDAQPSTIVKVCTDDWSAVPDAVIKALDLYVALDTTSSMSGSIYGLLNSVDQLGKEVSKLATDAYYGLAEFKDWSKALGGGGDYADFPFRLNQSLNPDLGLFTTQLRKLSASGGGDNPESAIEALYQLATGAGDGGFSNTTYTPGGIAKAEMGWRATSSKIVVLITDAAFSVAPTKRNLTYSQVVAALVAKDIRVIGISAGNHDGYSDLRNLALQTGAVAEADLDFNANGTIEPALGEFHKGDPLLFRYMPGSSATYNIASIITKGVAAVIGYNVDVETSGDASGLTITNLDGPKVLKKGDLFCFRMNITMNPDLAKGLRCPIMLDRDLAFRAKTGTGAVIGHSQAPLTLQPGPDPELTAPPETEE